jgi:hypothetical protein
VDRRPRDEGVDLATHGVAIGHVDGDEAVCRRTGTGQGGDHRLQRVRPARQHGHAGAEQREFVRRGAADAFGASADEGVAAFEVQVHVRVPPVAG